MVADPEIEADGELDTDDSGLDRAEVCSVDVTSDVLDEVFTEDDEGLIEDDVLIDDDVLVEDEVFLDDDDVFVDDEVNFLDELEEVFGFAAAADISTENKVKTSSNCKINECWVFMIEAFETNDC
ncbi:hypothetical protein BT63DRAFT_453651 [Microthyrium microscopicum]|uniref:Uncharacterized protein n=1 Tax=Microthyrium microscopicum TaxID=703497 RepID=A0A6A6UGD1_9PEZI|nr:hypothetical protein BT63DRAFT_453651 [Microthyrium microscopicum]